jgi:hypothetical protein
MNLVEKMREHESRSFWSMRWVIVASFLQAAGVFYAGLSDEHRARIPEWLVDLWGAFEVVVLALAAIAATMHKAGAVMSLPLGNAVMPGVLVPNEPHAAPAPRHAATMPEDAPAPAPLAPRPVGDYTPHPATPTSPNEPSPDAPEPAPDPDTTPIPVPPPPAPPAPAPGAPT